ncbi:hypothetical protein EA004_23310, partial [Vibrio anguillarum]|nr:hypothetical protein [Vibrio anguillarum]
GFVMIEQGAENEIIESVEVDGGELGDGADSAREMAQLLAIAKEIDGAQVVPLTEDEQARIDESERVAAIDNAAADAFEAQYEQAVAMGIDALWTTAAPNWKLEEAELTPMAKLTKMVIDKHFPNAAEKMGPEVMLGMIALTAISSRVAAGIPPRGEIKAKGGEDEQTH